jgi:hypothetical protein
MSLSPPVDRQPIHSRHVICEGYRRDDGLWDIEGRIRDTKAYEFTTQARGLIPVGEPIHEMVVRITIDDEFVIRQAEAVTEYAPYPVCGDVAPDFAALVGLRLGAGFRRQLIDRVGGLKGCTHLVELMGPIATTAFQTVFPLVHHHAVDGRRPGIIDQCHALAADGPIVARQWPQHAKR